MKENAMLGNLQKLFTPARKQAEDRMAALEHVLDAIALKQSSRYSRGNASIQMGLLETEEQLDAKRQITIARRL